MSGQPNESNRAAAPRVPPHAEEAEMGVLSSMLISPNEAIAECLEKVTPAHFFIPANQLIASALFAMFEGRYAIDMITLTQWLADRNELEMVGGPHKIAAVQMFVPSAANLASYLEAVREKFWLREMIRYGTEIARVAYEEGTDAMVALDAAQSALTSLSMERVNEESLRHIGPGVDAALDQLENAHANRGEEVVNGLATGFHDLDRILTGLKPQQFITIAGLTSHGKTAVATNIAEHVAVTLKKAVGIWSMEMSYDEQAQRLVCSVADVSLQRFRDGFLKDIDWQQIPERVSGLRRSPLYIDDTRGLSINDFRARARRAVMSKQLTLLIVDYVQLMHSPTKRAQENRAREIAEITGGLKSIAKELRIPVIGLAQLNRDADKRSGAFARPKLSDLKESSSIEQDSDVVICVYRPCRFIDDADVDGQKKLEERMHLKELNEKCEQAHMRSEEIDSEGKPYLPITWKNYAELIVLKQRNGPVGKVALRYEGDVTRFENVTPKMWSNNPKERQK